MTKIFVASILLVLVFSCSHTKKNDKICTNTNWQETGFLDGRNGYFDQKLPEYEQKCSMTGESVNKNTYLKGITLGLEKYCTFINGKTIGQAGLLYSGNCPKMLEKSFLEGFHVGEKIYKSELRDL